MKTQPITVLTIEYPNGAQRSLIKAERNYRCRDANGKTYRVNDQTARRTVDEFDRLCNEGQAKLVTIDQHQLALIRIHCSL
jgi:hypothetical protein